MFEYQLSDIAKKHLSTSNRQRYAFAYGYLSNLIRCGAYDHNKLKIIAHEIEKYMETN